jgi:hypothetical protein
VYEPGERPGVGLHRAAHVEQQHKPPRALTRFGVTPAHGLTSGAERGAHRAAKVGTAAIES